MLKAQNHLLHFIGRNLSTPGQCTHFVSNHSKTTPHLPGTRSFNRRIERQQVGLFGDTSDHRQDFVDRSDFTGQLAHSIGGLTNFTGHAFNMCNRAPHHFASLKRFRASRFRSLCCIARILGDVLHGQAHLMHRSGDHFGHFLLTPGTLGGVLHYLGHLRDRAVQALSGAQHFADQLTLAVEKAVEAPRQVAQFIGTRFIQALSQVTTTIANCHQRPSDPPNRPDNTASQQHHQQQRHQRHSRANQAGQPDRLAYRGVDLRLRHFCNQGPVEVAQWQAQGQVLFAIALEAAATHPLLSVQQRLCRRFANLLGELTLAAELLLWVNLNEPVITNEENPSSLTKAEVVNQRRQLGHAQAEPGNAHQLPGFFHSVIDKQRQFSSTAIGIDVEQARIAAVDKAVEPLVCRVAATQGAVQAFFVVIVVSFSGRKQCGERLILLPQGFEVLDELRRLGWIFARRQPVTQQGVVGNIRGRGERAAQHPFDVVTNCLNARRQSGVDQVTFGQAIDRHRVDRHDDKNAHQQGCAHACDQLPLDTAPPELHEPSPE
ncbi:hypothetical protein D3C80_758510 [compost metagenome]